MKKLLLLVMATLLAAGLFAQTYSTSQGSMEWSAKNYRKLDASHSGISASINVPSEAVSITISMADFEINDSNEKAKFESKYKVADYPDATIVCTLSDFSAKLSSPGTYQEKLVGTMTIAGVSKPVSIPCTITVANNKITRLEVVSGAFSFTPSLYGVAITGSPVGVTMNFTF